MIHITTVPVWETQMVKLTNETYAYVQSGGTMGLNNAGLIVGRNHNLLIDTLTTVPLTRTFLKEVRAVTTNPARYLIVTHHHGDHCFGNHLIPEAVSICHSNCRQEIERRGQPDASAMASRAPGLDFTGIRYTLPDVTFNFGLAIYLDGLEIRLLDYGYAHTVGDILVYVPARKVLFCGDLLFLYVTPLGGEGHFAGWIDSLTKISELDIDTYVPGHGPVCGREGLLECREYLMLLYHEGKKAFDAGLTHREAALRLPLGKFKAWAEPERILANMDRLYREFRGETPTLPIDREAQFREMRELAASGW
jgi:cyclase